MDSELERRFSRKLMLRIILFVMLLYFVSFLDRACRASSPRSVDSTKTVTVAPINYQLAGWTKSSAVSALRNSRDAK